jgi:hypothetical protein
MEKQNIKKPRLEILLSQPTPIPIFITTYPNDPNYTTNTISISTTNPETTGPMINYTDSEIKHIL